MKTLQQLIDIVRSDHRVCPQPEKWTELCQILSSEGRLGGSGSKAAPPLILNAWWYSSDEAKRARFIEHLRYADENGVLDRVATFLDGLGDEDWNICTSAESMEDPEW